MANASGANTLDASKIITTFDIDKPSVRQTLYRRHGDQGLSFFNLIESLGQSRPVTQNVTTQYEEDWIHQTIYLGNTMTNTGTNTYSFTISTSAPNIGYLEQNVTSPYSTADQYVFPIKVKDIITLPENNAKLLVTAVAIVGSTCTVTVKHMNPTATFTLGNYVAGTELIITGNAHGEGTDQPTGQVNKPIIDHAYTQIIKTSFDWTGSQAVSQPWFNAYSDDSGEIVAYVIVGQNNTEYEHTLAIDSAILFGALTEISIIDPSTVNGVASVEPIQTTEGLDPYIKRTGNSIGYTPGTFSISQFDYIDKILDQEMAPQWMMWACGKEFSQEKDNVLKAYFQNTMQKYMLEQAQTDVFSGDPGMAMAVNFNYLDKSNRKWVFSTLPSFNMKKLWGASGYKTPGLSLIFPMGGKPDKKNPSNRIPYMGTIYRELGGYSRKAEVWTINGAAPGQKITSIDRNKLNMRSDIGAEHCAGNMMVRLYPQ